MNARPLAYAYAPGVCVIDHATLADLLEAAQAYAEDLKSGLADGTYDDDPGLERYDAAIARGALLLADLAEPAPYRAPGREPLSWAATVAIVGVAVVVAVASLFWR